MSMFRNVIVGVDFHDGAYDAAALAAALAPEAGAGVELVGAYPNPLLPFPLVLGSGADARERAEGRLGDVRHDCIPHASRQAIADNSPARALRHVAEREHADLIVLGSEHRAEHDRAAAGRTGRQVVHGAPCAVAIAAAGIRHDPRMEQIVVGLDGSPESDGGVATAHALSRALGSRLDVVVVVDDRVPMVLAPTGIRVEAARRAEMVGAEHARAKELLERTLAERERAIGEVRVGDPAEELIEAGRDADLLVLGSRHWGPLDRLLIGSTSEELLRDAPCSLLLVPRPPEARHG
jgi:nucleotide-binding universal stress UspA family protein